MTCIDCSRFYEVIDPVDGSTTCMCYLKKVPVRHSDYCDDWHPSIWVTNKVLIAKREEFSEWLKRNFKKQ